MSYDPGFQGDLGALPFNVPTAPSAKSRLQRSRLKLTQREMMGDDLDLDNFFATFNGAKFNLRGALEDLSVERTVQGASTLTATITDEDYVLLDSGWLSDELTVEIDGLYWMLTDVKLQNVTINLEFQEREICIARRYNKPIKQSVKTSRGKITRAQFALRLLREIKELPPIPYIIPALKVPQPIGSKAAWLAHSQDRAHQKGHGIAKHNNLTVKGVAMSPEQARNADQILTTGASMKLTRKYLVAAIMCCIQESSIINLRQPIFGAGNYIGPNPDGNPVGCFQQIKAAGWPASRNIPRDAQAFYQHLGFVFNKHSEFSLGEAIYSVQNPGGGSRAVHAYARWQKEAERIVDAYGLVPGGLGSAADANNTYNAGQGDVVYEFYRGRPPTSSYQKKHGDAKWGKENTWDCWQRLASEVQWRCFFVSGTFYFISEDDLFKQHPAGIIDGDLHGIEDINGDYDSLGNQSQLNVTCRIGRWAAPPGSLVEVRDLGPWNGRWLVNDVQRGIFNASGQITLKKPLPALPEPDNSNTSTASQTQNGRWAVGGMPGSGHGQHGINYYTPGKIVQPVPRTAHPHLVQGMHQTAGLPGYPAADFGGDAGGDVVAVEDGKIIRLSGHDPAEGPSDPTMGVHGPFGWSIYLQGKSGTVYYYTHLGVQRVKPGLVVAAGEMISKIGNYAKWGGVNHVHLGVHASSKGHPDIYDIMKAPIAGAQ